MSRAAILFVLGFVVAGNALAAERKEGTPEQIRICVRNLSHELPRLRAAAARALAEIGGESAVEPLVERLTDGDADVRLSSASALGRINKRPLLCVEQLTKLLHDKDEHVRYAAQWAIGQFANGFLQSSAQESANDQPIGQLLASAAGVMAQTGTPESIQKRVRDASNRLLNGQPRGLASTAKPQSSQSSIDPASLVADLKDEDIYVQVRALSRLKNVESKNVAQLVRLLAAAREDLAMEWEIPKALAEAGRNIVPPLAEILRGDDEQVRSLALDVLTETRYGTEVALPQLNKILADKDAAEDELEKAIIAISGIGPTAKDSVALLAKVAANSELSETVRLEAINALAAIGPDAESALPTIKRVLRRIEELNDLRIGAAKAVIRISRKHDDTLKLLVQLVEDTDDTDLAAALAATLGDLGIHAAPEVPLIIALLEEPGLSEERRQNLVLAVGEIGYEAQQAVSTLIDLLTDQKQSEAVQVAAALSMKQIGPEAVGAMAELLRRPEAETRATIARAMVVAGYIAEEAVGELVRVLSNEDEENDTRVLVAIALGKIGKQAEGALPALNNTLKDDSNDSQLRAMCAIAIGSIDPMAANPLQNALDDSSPEVQVAAAYSLVKSKRGSPAGLGRLVKLLADDDAAAFAARALVDIGSDAVTPLCAAIFNPANDVEYRITCVDVLGDIGSPAVTTLIGLLDRSELAEAAREALSRQDQDIVPVLLLAAESTTEFTHETRESLKELVRSYYDGLGAGEEELSWGQAHPLAKISERTSLGAGMSGGGPGVNGYGHYNGLGSGGSSSGSKKVIRLGEPIAVMGKAPTEINAKGYKAVKVFYGTNRKQAVIDASSFRRLLFYMAAIAAFTLCIVVLWFQAPKNMWAISLTSVGLVVVAIPLAISLPRLRSHAAAAAGINYGGEYTDQVEMGVCEVTIPDIHEEGELEGPSFLKLDFKEDPERHIVLSSVQQLGNQAFFANLGDELNQKGRNVLVFIHGYNVSFQDAARRTAQMSADLKFPGAAVFYSWPSQAHWYKYRLDEKNVELSVAQLKSFLLEVAERSGATTINLVAHSMGNRLLTGALKELDASAKSQGALFNQVVLAAPDIDADVFKRQIAPAIVTKAHRVTLYASSKDLALYASRQFNSGDPRAGDAGDGMVVVPGIETIDASAGDSSLLGHCYYGSSISILHDIQQLLADRPARDRQFLYPISRADSIYWVFEPEGVASRPRTESSLR